MVLLRRRPACTLIGTEQVKTPTQSQPYHYQLRFQIVYESLLVSTLTGYRATFAKFLGTLYQNFNFKLENFPTFGALAMVLRYIVI